MHTQPRMRSAPRPSDAPEVASSPDGISLSSQSPDTAQDSVLETPQPSHTWGRSPSASLGSQVFGTRILLLPSLVRCPSPSPQTQPAGKRALRTRSYLLPAGQRSDRCGPGAPWACHLGSPSQASEVLLPASASEGPGPRAPGAGFCLAPRFVPGTQPVPRLQEAELALFCREPAMYSAPTIVLRRGRRVSVGG